MSDDDPTFISLRIGTRKKLRARGNKITESYDEILNRLMNKLEKTESS
jgi:hypothetical protein